ncbi:MAG: DNA gyrase subunit A [Erysipelotrichaceae bacterium]|nr:DNA gyrase subunit A [Erysipelotrichaceae bacterium]
MLDEKELLENFVDEEEEKEEEILEEEQGLEDVEEGIVPELIEKDLSQIVKSSFLEYAMSVIVSRALPDVRDGLKPVHRRIIYGMNELGNGPDKPHKKCARIVGDVMGRYHPHGDSSIYSALVRLAQPFSVRYTLVDGHGNFGSIDGDGAAAMRYTEARMSKIALEMVRDIKKDTVDFMDNYDGEEQEPVVLPARFPNLLVNGSNGIAVGMATNIPPHNLTETINAVQAIARNPELTPLEIMENYLYGPDFPTAGIILGRSGIKQAYETGQGSIIIRSKCRIEEMHNGKKRIIITEIPYQVNKANMIESIGKLVHEKVIEGITDIRDESNKEGIRVVIEVRKDVVAEVILNQLYKLTQLQVSYGIIMLALHKGEPKIMPINEVLKDYFDFQCEVIERRTRFDLNKALDRLHVLEGLLTAIDNIDEVVHIIRNSKTNENARNALIERFNLSEIQTRAILDMRLARLTGLERDSIANEIASLNEMIARFREILSDHQKVVDIVVEELEEIKEKYGDERKTEISNDTSMIDDEDLIPEEDIIITITSGGYIKRQDPDTFRSQKRGGKGVKGMSTHEDDLVEQIVYSKTHADLLFFTNLGKVYRIRGYKVPAATKNSKGTPYINLFDFEKEEKIKSIVTFDEYVEGQHLFFATKDGVVKRTSIEEFKLIRQNGKKAITMREGDELVDVKLTTGSSIICMSCDNGRMVKFHEEDVRPMGRTASGVKGMNVSGGNVVGLSTADEGELVFVISEHGYGKLSKLEDYRLTQRGSKGVTTLNMTEKTGKIITTKSVNGDEDIMVITEGGILIRTSLKEVSVVGRNTQGVKIIRIKDNEKVSSIAVVKSEEVEETTEQIQEGNQVTEVTENKE